MFQPFLRASASAAPAARRACSNVTGMPCGNVGGGAGGVFWSGMLLDRVDAGGRHHSVLRSAAAAGTDRTDDLALGNDQHAAFGSDHAIERHRGDAGASRAYPL